MATKPPSYGGGPQKILAYVTNEIVSAVKKAISDLGKFGCTKVNKVIAELRNEGANVPRGIDSWSCDQKIAFVAGLGPLGVSCLIAGALVAGVAGNAPAIVNKYGKQAEQAANAILAHSGVQAAANAVGSAAGDVGDAVSKAVKF